MSRGLLIRAILGGAAFFVLVVGLAVGYRVRASAAAAEYPDPPFPRMPADYPRILSYRDAPPRSDKAAYSAYQDERRKAVKFVDEEGAVAQESADAREAVRLVVRDSQYIKSRELALKALKENPDSVAARFALAIIETEGEENAPRALYMFQTLRKKMHARGVANPDDDAAREWYVRCLDREVELLRNVDRNADALRALDLIEAVYMPLPERRVWPLIKLHRYDEARKVIDQVAAEGYRPLNALNSRMVLASELHDRAGNYAAGQEAVQRDPQSAVLWSNFSGACTEDFRPAEAEAALVKSAGCKSIDFTGSPYVYLTNIYIQKNQMVEAWDAIRAGLRQRQAREPYTLAADQDVFHRTAAVLMLRLGRAEDALRFARLPIEQPGRSYNRTGNERDTDFTNFSLLHSAIIHREAEMAEERAARGESLPSAAEAELALERRTLERKLARTLADTDYLVMLTRPHLPGVPGSTPAEIARLVPGGVAKDAIRRARKAETHPGAEPYFLAGDATVAWRGGRVATANEAATQALAALDATYETETTAEMAGIAATSTAIAKDYTRDAFLVSYEKLLRNAPIALRTLGISIPVKITTDKSRLAEQMARRVLTSPRFRDDQHGFFLTIASDNGQLSFQLTLGNGTTYCQGSVPVEGDEEKAIVAGVRRLHARLYSPTLDLTPTDVNGLETVLFAAPTTRESTRLLDLAGKVTP